MRLRTILLPAILVLCNPVQFVMAMDANVNRLQRADEKSKGNNLMLALNLFSYLKIYTLVRNGRKKATGQNLFHRIECMCM